ncbi:MAG TPA: M20/M25/M40 family metallo-hydrolase [Bacteroidota bacterium]|nr:M20/M25/M40 family metallo-hydrolase [Bacteroidota bacterium]
MPRLLNVSLFMVFVVLLVPSSLSQNLPYDSLALRLFKMSLGSGKSYEALTDLSVNIGHRISGSPQAEKAVQWTKKKMEEFGLENVRLEPVMVPRWVRGEVEEGSVILPDGKKIPVKITALGGSIATPAKGISAEVVEVHSWEELRALGEKAWGKIVFFNRPFDRTKIHTFEGYGGAVDQRGGGAIEAAKAGGVMALVRSMTPRLDDFPHTGGMGYNDTVPKIPAAAISTIGANKLSDLLKQHPKLKVYLKISSKTLPDVESANVVGELKGSEIPNEVVVIGGHLDSWDKGQGAHDDGAGVVQCIDAVRMLKELGLRPRRTIRVVAFMNEENGGRGGQAYAAKQRPGEKHIAAIESDMGGFMPRGFTAATDSVRFEKIARWAPLFRHIMADRILPGGGGADISWLIPQGVPQIALLPEVQRYFNYHHADDDTIDNVEERELQLGAACMAILSYVLAQEGL